MRVCCDILYSQGKSMSLICSSLKWLMDHETRKEEELKALLKRMDEEQKTPTQQSLSTATTARKYETRIRSDCVP